MNNGKRTASLSPALLARKGAARPAMRPQFQIIGWADADPATHSDQRLDQHQQDLGWNDMGHDVAYTDDVVAPEKSRGSRASVLRLLPPMVVTQREALAAALTGAGSASGRLVRRSAFEQGRRAAFTLRVDIERHVRLRMACTIKNSSAQALVTEALDRILAEVEGLDDPTRRAQFHRKH